MADFSVIESYLQAVADRLDDDAAAGQRVKDSLRQIKADAVARGDQAEAKRVWCLEETLAVQERYVSAFRKLKAGAYYDAWCELERIQIDLHFLGRHFQPEDDKFKLTFIEEHVPRYQSLFPYKIFSSTEILEIEKVCSICRQPVSLRHPCGHRPGEIYNGEFCAREVTKAEIVGISLVERPQNKYSVMFLTDAKTGKAKDQYNYSQVRYLIERLASPFHGWSVRWTRIRHPHSYFKDVSRNDPCPCESGKKYKNCCWKESGVLRPHCQLTFSVPPPEGLNQIEYFY